MGVIKTMEMLLVNIKIQFKESIKQKILILLLTKATIITLQLFRLVFKLFLFETYKFLLTLCLFTLFEP